MVRSIDITNLTVELGQPAYAIYVTYFVSASVLVAIFLAVNMLRSRKNTVKLGLRRVLIAWTIGGSAGAIFNLLFPFLGNYGLIWVSPPIIIILLVPLSSTLITTVEHFSLLKTFLRGLLYCLFVFISFVFGFLTKDLVLVEWVQFSDRTGLERFGISALVMPFLAFAIMTLFWGTRKLAKTKDMGYMTENLFDASMIAIEKFELKKEPFDFAEAVDERIKGLQKIAEDRKVKLIYNRDKGQIEIDDDRKQLTQAVVSLIENAVQYTTTKIEVSLRKVCERVIFTVTDDGIGVPKADQEKIFEKMFRASNAEKYRPNGTGTGLHVVKETIDKSGGKIIFKSIEGKGSVFGFELSSGIGDKTGEQ